MPSFSFSYEYDRAGNRSKKINNLTSEVTTYVYDSANQLISMEGPNGTTTFDWDAAGNMIAKHAPEGTTTYTWDYENRLTQVAPPVGDPINFAYNAMGQRIQKNGTRFIYDGVQMLQETDLNNQTLRSNTFTNEGYGDLVSENDGTDSSFPTFNGQSSTDAIVNKTATVTDRISYSAFGGQDSHTGSSTTPFRFVGKQSYYNDAETGLYLLGAGGNPNGAGRYYDPELGRFISRDPIGLAGGDVNLYRYAGNNPVNGIDPTGLFSQTERAYSVARTKYYSRYKDQRWAREELEGINFDKTNPTAPAYEVFFHRVTIVLDVDCQLNCGFCNGEIVVKATIESERSGLFFLPETRLIQDAGIFTMDYSFYPTEKMSGDVAHAVYRASGEIAKIPCDKRKRAITIPFVEFTYVLKVHADSFKEEGKWELSASGNYIGKISVRDGCETDAHNAKAAFDFDFRFLQENVPLAQGKHLMELSGPNDPRRPPHKGPNE